MTTTPARAAGPAPALRRCDAAAVLGGLSNEIRKYLQNYVAGWRGVLIQIAVFPTGYLLLMFFMGHGHLRGDLLVPTLIGAVPLAFRIGTVIFQLDRPPAGFWGVLGLDVDGAGARLAVERRLAGEH